jgi:hypothetical protein
MARGYRATPGREQPGQPTLTTSFPTFLPSNSMLIAVGSCSKPRRRSRAVWFALLHQAGDLGDRLRRLAEVVEDDEALDQRALDEQVAEGARPGGGSSALLRDQPAQRHPGADVQPGEDRVHQGAADILEVDVDTVRRRGLELGGPVVGAVVDGRVEPEFVGQQRTLLRATRDSHHPRARGLGELAGHRAHRAGGGRDHDGLPGCGLPISRMPIQAVSPVIPSAPR